MNRASTTPLLDYADLETLSQQELVWLDQLGTRWLSTDSQYWNDQAAYKKWEKLGGNEWIRVKDDPRLQISMLRALVERGWAELEERNWCNTEEKCLQSRVTSEGLDAFHRLRDACMAACFAYTRQKVVSRKDASR